METNSSENKDARAGNCRTAILLNAAKTATAKGLDGLSIGVLAV
jgi:hypothetical protein